MSASSLLIPRQTPEAIGAGIGRLADRTLDRLSDEFAVYLADEERARDYDGTTLTADNEGVLWENGAYGRVPIAIDDDAARVEVFKTFVSQQHITGNMGWPVTTHRELIKHANEREESDRYKPVAATLLLHVLKDRYPEDYPSYRGDLMPRPISSSSTWGERHKVGVEFKVGYEDAWAPDHPAQWSFGVWLQSRFDMPEPQSTVRSLFTGLVNTHDIGFPLDFKPDEKKVDPASTHDLIRMSRLFEIARDHVQPLTTSTAEIRERQAALGKLFEDFLGRPGEEASASV